MSQNVELLDFFATWCGPCRLMKPVIEEIEKTYEGKIKVRKLDIDQNQEESTKYNVMSIPTILILKEGKVVNQLVGAQPKEALKEAIDSALKL